jgi:hypothetical protein
MREGETRPAPPCDCGDCVACEFDGHRRRRRRDANLQSFPRATWQEIDAAIRRAREMKAAAAREVRRKRT